MSSMKKVSKKIGRLSRKPPVTSARPARPSPNAAMNRRTTLSAAPLSITHAPMIEASAMTMPILPQTVPSSAAAVSTA